MIQEVRIASLHDTDPAGKKCLGDFARLGPFENIRTVKVYRLEGTTPQEAERFAKTIVDVDQRYTINQRIDLKARHVIEVGQKPGVMNPEAASIMKAGRCMHLQGLVAADSSTEYHFFGFAGRGRTMKGVNRFLKNKTVQAVITKTPETLIISGEEPPLVPVAIRDLTEEDLVQLSKELELSLTLQEMLAMQAFFRTEGREPYDTTEPKVTAARWSEHCCHKSFKSPLQTPEGRKESLFTRLQKKSLQYSTNVVSAFHDNSGVLRFYDGFAINGKVETHNSPSAIEPYGGAATGTGGVIRDILGTGKGAKVILSTDMFCFAPPDLPETELPPGCLHPRHLLKRVVAGVGDYGNRMGIPTANGSIHFHPDFRAKPSVIVGAYGIMPEKDAHKGAAEPGDLVVLLGGRTGRDGINGATFSSGEMTEKTATVNAGAVQIGNAIEEKRLCDGMLVMRDAGIIKDQTDCGAGGIALAAGELGSKIGVHIRLEQVPEKYPGLFACEKVLSESQERMIIVIHQNNRAAAEEISRRFNVEMAIIGEFTDTNRFLVTRGGEVVCDLPNTFLNEVPLPVQEAYWEPEQFTEPSPEILGGDIKTTCMSVLGHPNVSSKEDIVRKYDHQVQAGNVLTPFSGVHYDGPNDAVVLRPLLNKPYGVVVAHGMQPVPTRVDPYWGAILAGIEALANFTAAGGNPREGEAALIDNFIWPRPDRRWFGALDLAMEGCCTLVDAFHLPFISGKDSLSSTYRSGSTVIHIPPIICISVFGRIPDIKRTMSADFKRSDSLIYLVGDLQPDALGGSVHHETLGFVGSIVPKPDAQKTAKLMCTLHDLIVDGAPLAVHDVSDGGVAACLSEMCFGGDLGARIYLDKFPEGQAHGKLFGETPGCFLIEVPHKEESVMKEFGASARPIGFTVSDRCVNVYEHFDSRSLCNASLDELKRAWQRPMQEVFRHAA